MQVLRLSDATHKDVSQYAAKHEKKMSEVSDEIVRAGLAALASNGVAKAAPEAATPAETPAPDKGADAKIRAALSGLPDGPLDLVVAYQEELGSREKRAEKITLAETCGRLVVTAYRRLTASQKYAAKK